MTSLCKMPITITIWWWARLISPCSIFRWRATRLRLADTWCHGSSAVHPYGRASASWAIISGVNTFLPKWCNWFTIFWESLAKGWIVKIIYHYSYLQAILAKNLPISQQICAYREIRLYAHLFIVAYRPLSCYIKNAISHFFRNFSQKSLADMKIKS